MDEFDLLSCPLKGSSLIEASAGTGKTYAISGLFLRLVLEKKLPAEQVLVVTFTVAATAELRERIRGKLRDAVNFLRGGAAVDPSAAEIARRAGPAPEVLLRAHTALRDFDRAAIMTIHGFCRRVLQDMAFESGVLFETEFLQDETALREEIVLDFWRRRMYDAPVEFVAHAAEKGFRPDSLLALAGSIPLTPDLDIQPEAGDGGLPSLGPFRDACRRVEDAWAAHRESVLASLGDPALHRGWYGNPRGLAAQMDLFLSGGARFPLFKGFEKFTAGRISKATRKGCAAPVHSFFDLCEDLRRTGEALRAEADARLIFLKTGLLRAMRREADRRKQARNVQSFDDLLLKLYHALDQPGNERLTAQIRHLYRAALVDEFQDTDSVQYAIFRRLFGADGILFLIGDPKQAIYGFRGADLFAYLKAAGQADRRFTLGKNRRSEPALIKAVNAVFSRTDPFLYDSIRFDPAEPGEGGVECLTVEGRREAPFRIWLLGSGEGNPTTKTLAREQIAAAVAEEISGLVRLGRRGKARIGKAPLREADIAVLVRKNREAQIVRKALSALDIPSVSVNAGNLFDTAEAMEFARILSAVADPGREDLVRAALATELLGCTAERIDLLAADEASWEEILSRFAEYRELWERKGFYRMFFRFLDGEGVRARLLGLPEGTRRLANLLHLGEALHQEESENRAGSDSLRKWLMRRLDAESPRREEDRLRLESDEEAVRIVTIHKSKGLEYPVVFCPYHWDGSLPAGTGEFLYHDEEDNWKPRLVLAPTVHPARAAAERELLSENLRLLYVALTRARNRCYLAWGRIRDAGTSAPAYLFHSGGEEQAETEAGGGPDVFEALSDEEIARDIEKVQRKAPGAIRITRLPPPEARESGPGRPEETRRTGKLECRVFRAEPERDRGIASFTSLANRSGLPEMLNDLPDHDRHVSNSGAESAEGIFAFPAGARAGRFFHSLFESLDFGSDDGAIESLVASRLKEHRLGAEWTGDVCAMVRRVLAAPLDPDRPELNLARIPAGDRLCELEFHYPLRRITPRVLKEIFARRRAGVFSRFPARLEGLEFAPVRGFMRGFIDMVFRFGGRFHLLDWKSNLLGNRLEDYGPAEIAKAMAGENYILQYHIYAVALNRYLRLRVPGYDYSRHFGGVYYVFLRGMDPAAEPGRGVFRDLPGRDLVEELDEKLIGAD